MFLERPLLVWAILGGAGLFGFGAASLATASPGGPARMSELRLQGLAGYAVLDNDRERVGQVIKVDADRNGRTRYLHISLDTGGEVKVAAFRAYFDAGRREIELMLPQDILFARAGGAPEPAPIEPSV